MSNVFYDDEIVVAVDTNTIRNLCQQECSWIETFEKMADNKIHFCLTDVLIVELLNQFQRGSISNKEWEHGMTETKKFLSNKLPILPGKKQLFNLFGIFDIINVVIK